MGVVHKGCVVFTGEDYEKGRGIRAINGIPSATHAQWLARMWRACLDAAKRKVGGDEKLLGPIPDKTPETFGAWPKIVKDQRWSGIRKCGEEPPAVLFPGGDDERLRYVWLPRYTPWVPAGAWPEAPDWPQLEPVDSRDGGLALRDYQAAAVDAWVAANRAGVIQIPTRGGKTPTGCSCIARTPTPALVVAPSVELWNQWRVSLARWFVGIKIGIAGDGKFKDWDDCDVAVAIVNTLASWSDPEKKARLARFGLVVMDECKHDPSDTWTNTLAFCPGPYRLGLDATPYRSDGKTDWIFWNLGPLVYEIPQTQLQDEGHVLAPVVLRKRTGWDLPKELDGKAWASVFSGEEIKTKKKRVNGKMVVESKTRIPLSPHGLCIDEVRNQVLTDAIVSELREGRVVMGISDRIEHPKTIAALVDAAMGEPVCSVVTGATAKGARKRTMDGVKAGNVRCLLGTIGKEGFDAATIDTVAFLEPVNPRNKGDLLQRAARALTPAPGKEARILDFVDEWKPFQGWANGRAGIFRKLGWKIR